MELKFDANDLHEQDKLQNKLPTMENSNFAP